VVAALGLWIAYQQFRLQRYALRRDLTQQRLAIFNAVRELLGEVGKRSPPIEAVDQFNQATVGAPFLFGAEVATYLEELRRRYLEVWGISDQQADEGFRTEPAEAEALAVKREHRAWMRAQYHDAERVFKKYLDLSAA
jgi:hypothetical protein